MRRVRSRRLAGMVLGGLTFGAAVTFPVALGEGRRPLAGAELAPDAWLAPGTEPGPPGWVERVDARLGLRMPQLEDLDRRRVARTLVVEAEAARIDPLLVLALIEIESAYDPEALSFRGARGLMQLREPTLRREVERAGLEWDDAGDPAVNVQAGIRYLRRLLDAFGREEVALMAYNAGPNRILGYVRDGEIPERFRGYPRKVKAEVRRLRQSWGAARGPTVALADPAPVQ
ncbi:MAG TPA: lytic transglycosylase domain-containing protein [Anaeromyxobacter sp.]